jgi:hypothetical protein
MAGNFAKRHARPAQASSVPQTEATMMSCLTGADYPHEMETKGTWVFCGVRRLLTGPRRPVSGGCDTAHSATLSLLALLSLDS